MPLERRAWITRQMLKDEPATLFVFGDNFERKGRGGQAAVMRGAANAVGLVTKRKPTRESDAYLTDADYEAVVLADGPAVGTLYQHLRNGGLVVWPADGIGTGLAQLAERAPAIALYYDTLLRSLEGRGVSDDGKKI